jgi:mRNA interferase MazF
MGTFTKGDIVLFPFPYTNLVNRKIRPCLILSEEIHEDILLCQITSKKINADEYSVELKTNETVEGTLYIDSYIRSNMLFTADKSQILKRICKISDNKYNEVVLKIIELIKK